MKTLRFSLIKTLPVLFGYLFMGAAFGILLQKSGYNFIWAFFISVFCYAGSMQFVLIDLLTGGASLARCVFMTFMINFRHVFYGLSLVQRFKGMGRSLPYMIHSLTDETYSLHCLIHPHPDLNEKRVMLTVSALNQSYWVVGSVVGALLGPLLTFNTAGIDFAMTALFTVILVEQWQESKDHQPAIIGVCCAVVSLFLFGATNFLPPALIACVVLLLSRRTEQPKHNQEV